MFRRSVIRPGTAWAREVAVLFILSGCSDPPASDSRPPGTGGAADSPLPQPVASAAPPRATLNVHARMEEHFVAASALRRALVRVDMREFRAAAAELSGEGRGDDVWDAGLDAMRASSRRAQAADDASSAAASLVEIAGACASCHTMLNSPAMPIPPEPGEASSSRPHARRYEWAIDLMWTGMVGSTDAEWRRGAQVLALAEPRGEDLVVEGRVPAEFAATSAAARTADAAAPTGRARAYEMVLSTCTGCHEAWSSSPPSGHSSR